MGTLLLLIIKRLIAQKQSSAAQARFFFLFVHLHLLAKGIVCRKITKKLSHLTVERYQSGARKQKKRVSPEEHIVTKSVTKSKCGMQLNSYQIIQNTEMQLEATLYFDLFIFTLNC